MEFEEFKMAKKEKNTFQNTGLYSPVLTLFRRFPLRFRKPFSWTLFLIF